MQSVQGLTLVRCVPGTRQSLLGNGYVESKTAETVGRYVRYNWNYKVEEDEVGGTCGTNGREEERV
jgi:hypothetical protein